MEKHPISLDISNNEQFFHVCTDGQSNGIVHTSDTDYRQSIVISAISAYLAGVKILCFCHMSSHSHFVIRCRTAEQARNFAISFKRDYARYMFIEHGMSMVYRDVNAKPREITDLYYLRNCISYVLLNPVAACIVPRPEDYQWSSFNAYFGGNQIDSGVEPLASMTVREIRATLRTRHDLKHSGFVIDNQKNLLVSSFVDFKSVESIFGSRTDFYRSLLMTKSASEEEKYVEIRLKYSDDELLAEVANVAANKYNVRQLSELTKEQKRLIALHLKKKSHASVSRIARVLRMKAFELRFLKN